MTALARRSQPRGTVARIVTLADDFMNWLLFGYESWLVAVMKAVPFFLFVYFILTYIPNYVYHLITLPQFGLVFSDEFGFLVANSVGIGNFVILILLALWAQAARGRRGFGWSLIRIFALLNYLFILLVLIPFMAFNLAGGTFLPDPGEDPFPFQAIALGAVTAGAGAMTLAYLYFEFRRVTRREAEAAAARSAAYQAS
jgi:DMSO/TMAO reductase YedYZ heme-binding membrane subunit